jgi:ubiquinone/menaquinone biosynthesis C-methylase UbiE
MNIRQTRKHWEKFARTDPFWAVLTAPGRENRGWSEEEFFRTGRESVAAELKGVRMHWPALRTGRALDFGCGVGRLTQALAEHFDEVTGVDIAEQMLELARRYNRHGERVHYLHNTQTDLRILPDGHFDFVYSIITLQHMEPRYAKLYIAEFARVCARGGVVLFQVPGLIPPAARDRFRFSVWPPTLWKRVKRHANRTIGNWLTVKPIMEMHAIPREEVLALIAAIGLRVVVDYRYDAAGPEMESWGYLAVKP